MKNYYWINNYFSIDTQILTLCLCPFAAILMQNVFNFYYVKIFLQNYRLDRGWFNFGQICFMIWNTLNDPIFGCWQNAKNDHQPKKWWHRRRKVIFYVGPFYALSFLTPWFQWEIAPAPWVVGVHFLTSLFVYDGLYSFVLIGWCSLYTEITTEHKKRIRAVKYLQYEKLNANRTTENSNIQISLQICKDRDFLAFVFMNFLTVIRTTVHANFTAIFTEHLIPQEIFPKGSWMISTFYGILSVLPQILVFVWSPLVNKFGCYKIFMTSFACSVVFSAIMGIVGSSFPILIIIFMIIDTICIDSIAPLTTILNADIVDADFEKRKRKFKVSSIFFGLNALITKPAVSLAPLFVVFVLNQFNYDRLIATENHTAAVNNASHIFGNRTVSSAIDFEVHYWQNDVKKAMFVLLWTIPLVVGLGQLLVFWKYSLRKTHVIEGENGDEKS
uniref:Transmembrane protein 180 n=1 Tax=Romanomermis culicivorax TaxID=13658 RepID=A0A915IYT4_ROMCU